MKSKKSKNVQRVRVMVGGAILLAILIGVGIVFLQRSNQPTSANLFHNPIYTTPFANEVAQGLNLSPQQLQAQVTAGKSMTDIATSQGVSVSQIHTVEMNAFQHLFAKAVQAGQLQQQNADQSIQQFRANPQMLDTKTVQLLSGTSK